MALSLTFTGFVEEAKTFDWGSVVTVAHANRKKNEEGKWETVSRDYIDVSVDPSSDFGWLLKADKGTRVTITGNAKLSTYEKRDGSSAVKIKLYPQAVESAVIDRTDAPF
jgi:single-stranded DNA-binding protein